MKILINCLVVLSLFFSTYVYAVNEIRKPTYKELVEQQLFIYEMKRNIEKTEQEMAELKGRIQKNEKLLLIKQEEIKNKKEKIKEILLQYYAGDYFTYGEVMLKTKDIDDMMMIYQLADFYIEKDKQELELFYQRQKEVESIVLKLQKDMEKQKKLNQEFQEKLNTLKEEENTYKEKFKLVDDITRAKKEIEMLLYSWENEGLETFELFFKTVANTIRDLPKIISKESIHSKGIFTHQLRLKEEELNSFLKERNSIFEHSEFKFENQKMMVTGVYKKINFYIEGHYKLKNEKELLFVVDEIIFEDIKLPKITVAEFQESYDLGFYTKYIMPSAKINHIKLNDGVLDIEINIK